MIDNVKIVGLTVQENWSPVVICL